MHLLTTVRLTSRSISPTGEELVKTYQRRALVAISESQDPAAGSEILKTVP